ncbi:arylsulfatase [Coraliomargarita algicola]|uniref:Arylsulfatase n=1 Tax=Coraliomargarita algicola TaxID=3092156 RepID=A0ABZ0RJ62_9BACT|nr:arylsulfatase [Coraliomargarita sp. J2-16]WPJ96240.1 arylsulfatase [Coraliomargarita sp. J2-16]
MKTFVYVACTCALFLTAQLDAKSLAGSRPNIILVISDDQGMGDLSCMGNELVRTPNIDRFYEGATRFTDFQVSPTCAPTRAALMSGRFPFKVGVTHTIQQRERMALDVFTMPQVLQSAGYATGLFGKWHLGDESEYLPQSRGFDEVLMHGAGGIGQTKYGDFPANETNPYFDNVLLHNDTVVQTKGFCTEIFFDAGLAWIKEQHAAEVPYFAYIALNAPHGPFIAPDANKERLLVLGCDETSAARLGMVENIDENFGKLMSKLEEWGALENTIVIFMTDNGAVRKGRTKETPYFNAGLKGGKNSPNEGGTHVPFFVQWQGVTQAGTDIGALAAHIDLYKTFSELAGATLPAEMQDLDGRSLVPLLEDPEADWEDRELFIHCGRWRAGEQEKHKYAKCAVRTQRWRLVNNQELYDISRDPGEKKDVAQQYPEVVEQLRKSYDAWWDSALPLMVNEGLPVIAPKDQPFAILYDKQLKEKGIPDWAPAEL